MPIPTRTLSLREPTQRRKPTGGSQEDTVTPATRQPPTSRLSRTTSVSTSTSTSSSTSTSKPPSHAHTISDSGVSRRSLLPQRHPTGAVPPSSRITAADRSAAAAAAATPPLKLQVQVPELQPQTRQSKHVESVRSAVSPSRRDSLGLSVKRSSPNLGPDSLGDGKQQQQKRATEQVGSTQQTRTVQTPGTRLDRSASLRQPAVSRVTSVATTTPGHARHRSQVFSSTGTVTRQEKSMTGENQSVSSRAAAKPQFNMYQQHYSPKKPAPAPKASMNNLSTVAADGSNNNNNNGGATLPAHIPPLQIELLQLHLLHSQALSAKHKWETSADEKCRKLHGSVVKTYQSVLTAEREIQRNRNAAAIEQFAADIKACNSRYDFPTQVQMLSKVIQTVSDLTETREGRYNLAVREFEEWFIHAMDVRRGRLQSANAELQFIEPLGDAWGNEVATLSAKLELCSRELDCLEIRDAMPGDEEASDYDASALVKAFRGHKVLVQSMVEELDTMAKIEAEMVMMERRWVKRSVDSVVRMGGLDDNVGTRKPAWMRT